MSRVFNDLSVSLTERVWRRHPEADSGRNFCSQGVACNEARERWWDLVPFDRRLRALKKDFQRNVGPSLRRHRYFLSKGERSRLKHDKAIKRLHKKRFERTYG